ncbi:MAG: sugar kinase [Rhizobiaceae bacterium]|nr:sugar kinase [Rhizobiaceae bacterium]
MISAAAFERPEGRPRRVLCVGAAVLDTLFRVRTMPTGQGKILPYDMLQIAEGMASSAAYAVAQLGGSASLWGAVGDDETGSRILSDLKASGIDTDGMVRVEGARSAVSTILVDDAGERLIVPFYDPRLHDVVPSVSASDIEPFDAVLVDVRWPQMALRTLKAARAAGKLAILDGDVAPESILELLVPAASHAVFSEPAARRLSTEDRLPDIVAALKQRFSHAFICVTSGEKGCCWFDEEKGHVLHMPALAVDTIDTLAAGDIFHGAFALAIAEQQPVEQAIRIASVAAALKCQVFGGRTGAPTRDAVNDCLRQAQLVSTLAAGSFET